MDHFFIERFYVFIIFSFIIAPGLMLQNVLRYQFEPYPLCPFEGQLYIHGLDFIFWITLKLVIILLLDDNYIK